MSMIIDPYRFVSVASNYGMQIGMYTGDGSYPRQINTVDMSNGGFLLLWEIGGTNPSASVLVSSDGSELRHRGYNSSGISIDTSSTMSLNASGFSIDSATSFVSNDSGKDYLYYAFSNEPGIFEVIKYTGNATARTIAHGLGAVPRLVMVFSTDQPMGTCALQVPGNYTQYYNFPQGTVTLTTADSWDSTAPTSSVVSIGTSDITNKSGQENWLIVATDQAFDIAAYTGSGANPGSTIAFNFTPDVYMVGRNSGTSGNRRMSVMDSFRSPGFGSDDQNMNSASGVVSSVNSIEVSGVNFQPRTDVPSLNAAAATYTVCVFKERIP